ncbi:MAG: radical SAM protein, partial [Rhodospirillales bacterium]|nr:radical SAM protein [Rhodospirillales bacterium]
RVMPHLHLSLQAGDDLILKRMKRRHLLADAARLCEELRALRSDIVFGADLIAGFPTETEAMFENTLRAVEDLGLTYLHVFPYSPRPGTPAARMPQVPAAERKTRAARLREAGKAALARFLERRVGSTAEVLVETPDFGRSEHYAPVALASGAVGEVVRARITGAADGQLTGVPAA